MNQSSSRVLKNYRKKANSAGFIGKKKVPRQKSGGTGTTKRENTPVPCEYGGGGVFALQQASSWAAI
jgi:hypothetical protein